MERVTFPDPRVQAVLADYSLAKIDIDLAVNTQACRQHYGHGGIPTFVVLGADGSQRHRWIGAEDSEGLIAQLDEARSDGLERTGNALDQHAALFEFYARRNNARQAAAQLEAMAALDPQRRSAATERAFWSACTIQRQRRDWPALQAATERYLTLPSPTRHGEALLLAGIARFETRGETSPELQQHIEERITILGIPFPGATVGDRLRAALGRLTDRPTASNSEAAEAWVDACNLAMDELTQVGAAASDPLRQAILTRPTASQHAASVLGRLRLPDTVPWLLDRIQASSTPAWALPNLIRCASAHRDERMRPHFIGLLGRSHPTAVRVAAAWALRDLATMQDGTDDQAIADALVEALDSRAAGLRTAVLQTLMNVHAPLPLDRLLDVLDDQREMFLNHRICDNALWVIQQQMGASIVRSAEPEGEDASARCSEEVVDALAAWYADAAEHLQWDAAARHYVDRRR